MAEDVQNAEGELVISGADIDTLKEKHGEVHLLSDQDDMNFLICKPANKGEWDRFQSNIMEEETKPIALKNLVAGCTVWPDKATRSQMFGKYPGLIQAFGSKLVEITKARNKVTAKKL